MLLVAITWRQYIPVGPLPGALIICWTLAAFLGMGLAPFHGYVAGMSSAPAILAIFLVPLGIPLLGALTFIDMMSTQGPLISEYWRTLLIIVAIISALGTAVGAIGSTRLRTLYGWHSSAVYAVLVLAAVSDLQILAYGVPVLLITAMLSLSIIALSIAFIETRNYTDDLLKLRPRARIGFSGVLLFVAVAASIGLPGTIGFISRWWMAEVLMIHAPWIIIAILISGSVLGLAWAGALSTIWRRIPKGSTPDLPVISAIPTIVAMLSPMFFAGLLLVTGFVPQLLWKLWLDPLQARSAFDSVITPPTMPGIELQLILTAVSVLLVAVPIYASRLRQRDIANPNDVGSTSVPPVATAESLSFLSSFVSPTRLLASIWQLLIRFGNALQWVLRLGEERYYVAGLVLGLIVIVLLLI
jgi:formate hydrogenlyase subunit 3/multisubunit Na+/H+ antiporter MnhD subunit